MRVLACWCLIQTASEAWCDSGGDHVEENERVTSIRWRQRDLRIQTRPLRCTIKLDSPRELAHVEQLAHDFVRRADSAMAWPPHLVALIVIALVLTPSALGQLANFYTNTYTGDVRILDRLLCPHHLQGTYYGYTAGGNCNLRTPSAPATSQVWQQDARRTLFLMCHSYKTFLMCHFISQLRFISSPPSPRRTRRAEPP